MTVSLQVHIHDFIKQGLIEDVGEGDHTSLACIPPSSRSKAKLLVKEDCILAGMELFEAVFRYVDPQASFEYLKKDGDWCQSGDIACFVEANSQALLKGERLALNAIQRMCGIATLSKEYADLVADLPVKILDTRKTTPLIRFLEKWAVRIGGCTNYRDGLYDRIMIKDNHVEAAGGMRQALDKVHAYQKEQGLNLPITVEVRNEEELRTVLEIGRVDQIMLDNFSPERITKAIGLVAGRIPLEASGGIHLDNLRDYALTGVDFISSGALTHSVQAKDLSLKIIE